MRNEKLFVAGALALGTVLTVLYVFSVRNESRLLKDRHQGQQDSIAGLESKVKALTELKESLARAQEILQQDFKQEQEKARSLEDKLAKSLFENKVFMQELSGAKDERAKAIELRKNLEDLKLEKSALEKELQQLRAKFELMQPIRQRMESVAQSLSSLELQKQKEDVLNAQLASISRDMASVNNYLLQLLKNNISPVSSVPVPDAAAKPDGVSSSHKEFEELKKQFEAVSREQAALKEQYQNAQEMLKQNQTELNSRAEKIVALQDRVIRMEREMMQMQTDAKEIEKNAAVLRERLVAVELEKGALRIALEQTKAELSQVQQKFLALLTKIGGIFHSGEELPLSKQSQPQGGSGKIDVELFPQENKP